MKKNMEKKDRLLANPYVILREEFDDWAILFNPDAELGFAGFGLNPSGVCLWKLLNGQRTIDELLVEMTNLHEAVPEEAGEHIGSFVDALVMQGLATYPDPGCYRETDSQSDFPALDGRKRLPYEPPNLIDLSSGKAARGDCGGHGSQPGDCYMNGNGALGCCNSGGCPLTPDTPPCCPGTCGATSCGDGNYACEHGWGCTGGAHNDGNCGLGNSAQYVCGTGSSPGNTCQSVGNSP